MSALGFPIADPWAWIAPLMVLGILLNGLRLRGRARGLPPLQAAPEGDAGEQPEFLVAQGVAVDPGLRRVVAAYAAREHLDVVDLIPRDLPADAALSLLRNVDPATYSTERLAPGRSAGQAVLVSPEVLRRAAVKRADAAAPEALLADVVELKKCAPASTALVTVPGLRAGDPGGRRARLHASAIPVPAALAAPLLAYIALAVGVVANPGWGIAALVLFSVQPYLIFAGSGLRPRDLHTAALGRLVWDPAQWLRAAFGPLGTVAEAERAQKRARIEQARPAYAADIASGVDHYFEPRRADCPWCGSADLAQEVSTPDLHQGKPGRFVLDKCRACGHVFQNPRLTIDGLDFYYRDFYDGAGANQLEGAFGAQTRTYRERAETLRAYIPAPSNWLDVGTGHGHFCTVARDAWPHVAFDGLDMTDGIDEAARRGWVDHGFRGMFPDLAGELAGRYDVVSMSHYLEHTREPFAELEAASAVLRPGGHLLIEVPDPEWPAGGLFKRYWLPWLQPQHQHLIPVENLKRALTEGGLEVVGEQRDVGRVKFDVTSAAYLLLHPLTRDPDTPWARRAPGAGRQLVRAVALAVAVPLMAVAVTADCLLGIRHTRHSNAYRVIARKPLERAGVPA
ncbi:MAG TPA: class I SAM-dependent methyltransferase [Actinomycetota bacterium]|nr:class I SAM-dependent methyltransferase [Actinomycetota bacterium]